MNAVLKLVEPTVRLRKYQLEGVAHVMRRPFGGLLMPPGTGKTVCVLSAFYALQRRGLIDRLLVCAPLRPCYSVWPAEIAKWNFPFQHVIYHGAKKAQALAQATELSAEVGIINYDGLKWLADNWDGFKTERERVWLVLDESTFIKRSDTQRFATLKTMLKCFSRRTILTGTPAPNGLLDLFGQVYAVDLGERLGQYITQYRRKYFLPIPYGWVLKDKAEKLIYRQLEGLFYRVDEKVLKLPPVHRNPVTMALPIKMRAMYKRLEDDLVATLRKTTLTVANAGVLTMKLRQLANGFLYDNAQKVHLLHEVKVDALLELVDELSGEPLLVGYEFTPDADRLQRALKKAGVRTAPTVGGRLSPKRSNEIFAEFNQGGWPVMLCQSGAVAFGNNLQDACHTIARFGYPWRADILEQFKKRVHRSGQRHRVIDHHLIVNNTIDELMWRVLQQKQATETDLLLAIKKQYA